MAWQLEIDGNTFRVYGDRDLLIWISEDNSIFGRGWMKEQMAKAVRAVNHHDELVAAVTLFMDALEKDPDFDATADGLIIEWPQALSAGDAILAKLGE